MWYECSETSWGLYIKRRDERGDPIPNLLQVSYRGKSVSYYSWVQSGAASNLADWRPANPFLTIPRDAGPEQIPNQWETIGTAGGERHAYELARRTSKSNTRYIWRSLFVFSAASSGRGRKRNIFQHHNCYLHQWVDEREYQAAIGKPSYLSSSYLYQQFRRLALFISHLREHKFEKCHLLLPPRCLLYLFSQSSVRP